MQATADMSCVPLPKTKEMVPLTEETARGMSDMLEWLNIEEN